MFAHLMLCVIYLKEVNKIPTYEFRCSTDKSMLEIQQGFYDNTIPNCPVCGKEMTKVIHATPAVFRGDGWAGKK